jgi:hypothetical protein
MRLYESIKPLKEATYLHLGNGGVTIGMEYNKSGMNCLKLTATHMAAETNELKVPITKDALRKIILDLVDELEDWKTTKEDYDLAAKGSSKTVFGKTAQAVSKLIGEPQEEEQLAPNPEFNS